jgi:hypothetical protein
MNYKEIILTCKCGATYNLKRDQSAPKNATSMGCNWCPSCHHSNHHYNEWYNYDAKENEPEIVDPNQLDLFKSKQNDITIQYNNK